MDPTGVWSAPWSHKIFFFFCDQISWLENSVKLWQTWITDSGTVVYCVDSQQTYNGEASWRMVSWLYSCLVARLRIQLCISELAPPAPRRTPRLFPEPLHFGIWVSCCAAECAEVPKPYPKNSDDGFWLSSSWWNGCIFCHSLQPWLRAFS